jgi:two-component system, cell cycle response regulator
MKVLIAEDSAVARVMLQRAIAGQGHECLVAEDGAAAWDLFLHSGADVIISDWMMPSIDGDELCRRVRAACDRPYTYFILLSSLEDSSHVLRGMGAGADDYLKKPFDDDDLQAKLISAARVTQLHASLDAQRAELETLNQRLLDESRHDPLTRLGNRIALREQLAQLGARNDRYQHTYAVALFDLDCFKLYNDSCGHLAGDRVLKEAASVIAEQCRRADGAYRYGGEELLVVLPEQTLQSAARAAERMRTRIEALAIPHPGRGVGAVVTVSAGIAQLCESDCGDFEGVLKRADDALYRAKERGKNRVETACDVAGDQPEPGDHTMCVS